MRKSSGHPVAFGYATRKSFGRRVADGRLTRASPAARAADGWATGESIGHPVALEAVRGTGDSRPEMAQLARRDREGGADRDYWRWAVGSGDENAMYVFLGLNGWEVEAPEPEVIQTMLALADRRLDEER